MIKKIEYIWVEPSRLNNIHCKTKIHDLPANSFTIKDVPFSYIDELKTSIDNEKKLLVPVSVLPDPQRQDGIIALCDRRGIDGSLSEYNFRYKLSSLLSDVSLVRNAGSVNFIASFKQEFLILSKNKDENSSYYSSPYSALSDSISNSKYNDNYCTINSDHRDFIEDLINLCLSVSLPIRGSTFESYPFQWSVDIDSYDFDLVKMADNIIFLRFLTQRLAEKYGYQIVFDTRYFGNTRVDNNLITTISSDLMRGDDGIKCLNSNLSILKNTKNSLASIFSFSSCEQIHDRVRIPNMVLSHGRGFIEDRRPNGSADPYSVLHYLISTIYENEVFYTI